MGLVKKTTILFSPVLHEQLSRLASAKGVSLGELVRTACVKQYGLASSEERLDAVRALAALRLPVGEPDEMDRESVPAPETLAL